MPISRSEIQDAGVRDGLTRAPQAKQGGGKEETGNERGVPTSYPGKSGSKERNEAHENVSRSGAAGEAPNRTDGSGTAVARGSTSSAAAPGSRQTSVSDSLAAAMPGSFLTATDLQELARVYVVCLK